jgi:type IV secretion system protein TrbL
MVPLVLAPSGPALDLPGFCAGPLLGPVCDIAGVAKSAASTVTQVADFASDPLGYIATKMQDSAAGLAGTVLPAMNKLTQPDLSANYFLKAYGVSFALALFVFVAFMGYNFVLLSRRRVSGDEVAETMGLYVPLFLGGTIFGPMIGTMLLQLTGALSESLISWGIGTSVGKTTDTFTAAIAAGDPAKITGGAVVAIVFFGAMIIALVLTFIVLLVMLVTLYLTGAIIPLSLVWLVHPRQRGKGLKVVMVWVGICFSHVLLFLLLGVAFALVTGLSTKFDDPGLTILANLAVAVIALLMATLSPIGLMRFAPVGPSAAGGGGPSMSVPSGRSGGGYPASASDSQTAQMARDTASSPTPGGGGGTESGGDGGGRGGLMGRLAASRSAGESSTSMEPTDSGGSAPVAGDAAGGLGRQGHTQQAAGSQLATAGTAAEATGIGAPVGAAMQAAGVALQAGGAVLGSTAALAQAGGDMAAEHMEHGDGHDGGSDARSRPGW